MRTMKRLLTCLLSVALVVSAFVMPVFAEPTIDPNAKGSITINKKETRDNENVPLAGVEFTIYQIATINQQVDQNGSVEVVLTPVSALEGLTITGKTTYTQVQDQLKVNGSKLTVYDDPKTVEKEGVKVTGNNGQVVFNNLPVGVYMVEETNAPAQIVNRSANFLVSIPMVNATGDGWNYNVVAEPKNVPVRGGINLIKFGKVGATESILEDAVFTLEQKASNDSWTTVTTDSKGNPIEELSTDESGMISINDLAPGTYRFRETGLPADSGYILDAVTAFEFVINRDGSVDIVDENNEYNIGSAENPIYAIKVVNEKPNLEKEVLDGNEWKEGADAAKSKPVEYRLTVDVPTNVARLKTFKLEDTMTNQTYVDDSLAIKVIGGENEEDTELTGYQVEVNEDKNQWIINFNSTDDEGTITSLLEAYAGKTLVVTFKTMITDDAITTDEGNPNSAKVIYSNKILPAGEPTENYIEDKAKVFTFKIGVEKVDGKDTSKKLSGAEFDLYMAVAEGTEGALHTKTLTEEDDANEINIPGLPDGWYVKVNASSLVTGEDGEISVHGLENGNYYLVETKAPIIEENGETIEYNLLKAPVEIVIAVEYEVEWSERTDTDGNITETLTTTKFNNDGDNGLFQIQVKNKTGFELPTTGGIGTIAFTVIGATLIIGGALLLRNKKEEDVA